MEFCCFCSFMPLPAMILTTSQGVSASLMAVMTLLRHPTPTAHRLLLQQQTRTSLARFMTISLPTGIPPRPLLISWSTAALVFNTHSPQTRNSNAKERKKRIAHWTLNAQIARLACCRCRVHRHTERPDSKKKGGLKLDPMGRKWAASQPPPRAE